LKKVKVVFLYCSDKFDSYSIDWKDAFQNAENIDGVFLDMYDYKKNVAALKNEITKADFIVALHSSNTNPSNIRVYMHFVSVLLTRKIPFITFVGNEYNIPFRGCRLSEKINLFKLLKPEILCTQLPQQSAKLLYGVELPNTRIAEYPHALNEKTFVCTTNYNSRKIDVGIKTGRYGNYLGDSDRNRIIDFFKENSYLLNLSTSIDAIKVDRAGWVNFLNTCKATIGNESGTNYTEPNDKTVIAIMDYVVNKLKIKKQPFWFNWFEHALYNYKPMLSYKLLMNIYDLFNTKLYFMRFAQYNLYAKVADYDFEEIFKTFFKNYANPISTRCISSRHFDAIGTKTAQLLFRGNYNGILRANEHYLSVNHDFSNINDVLQKFKDESYMNNMLDKTHQYIHDAHLYKHRVAHFCKNILNSDIKVNSL
jgi:hypothetical protein